MKIHNDIKVAHLEKLGFKNVEDNVDCVIFDGDYDGSQIDMDYILLTDTANDIERKADYISCCGAVLDKDYMICPECKEHC